MIELPWTKEFYIKVLIEAGIDPEGVFQCHYNAWLKKVKSWKQYWNYYDKQLSSIGGPKKKRAYEKVYYDYKVQKLLELDVAKVSNKEVQ